MAIGPADLEALALEPRDLDLTAGTLRIRHGKGDKPRTVGVDEQTAALLAHWLDRRRKLSPAARTPIFCTLAGGRLDPSYVRHLLPRLARKAGIQRRVHAHGLRHTYAAEQPASTPQSTSSETRSGIPASPSPTAIYETLPPST